MTANEAFCRTFKCTEAGLIGRDVRDLLRQDWRLDFRSYVARALVGVGDLDVTLPMVAPCGEQAWFKHNLEPRLEDGRLTGYRATMEPYVVATAEPPKRWWEFRPAAAFCLLPSALSFPEADFFSRRRSERSGKA